MTNAKGTGAKTKVLVVDDEPGIVELLTACLEGAGYNVVSAFCGTDGLRAFFEHRPDLVILDILMPEMDGLQVCQRIRELSTVPVIFLSARDTEDDVVKGLTLGADDYMCKPVGMKELVSRVEAALRRSRLPATQEPADIYQDSVVSIDSAAHRVKVRGQEADLTPLEYKLLVCLVRNAGKAMTNDQILDQVWGQEFYSSDAVKWYVSQLRRKIERDPADPELIVTVRGVGYRYEKPPAPAPSAPPAPGQPQGTAG